MYMDEVQQIQKQLVVLNCMDSIGVLCETWTQINGIVEKMSSLLNNKKDNVVIVACFERDGFFMRNFERNE